MAYKPRKCVYCGKAGPRVYVYMGYAHRHCIAEKQQGKAATPPPMKSKPEIIKV